MATDSAQQHVNGPAAVLSQPVLHARGFYAAVTDEEVVGALEECLKVRPRIPREGKSRFEELRGTIEFQKLYNGAFILPQTPLLKLTGDVEQPKRPTLLFTTTPSTTATRLCTSRCLKTLKRILSPQLESTLSRISWTTLRQEQSSTSFDRTARFIASRCISAKDPAALLHLQAP